MGATCSSVSLQPRVSTRHKIAVLFVWSRRHLSISAPVTHRALLHQPCRARWQTPLLPRQAQTVGQGRPAKQRPPGAFCYQAIKLRSFRNDAPMLKIHNLTPVSLSFNECAPFSSLRLFALFRLLIPFTGLFCPAPKTWFSATPTTTRMVPATILFAASQGPIVPRCRRCDRGRRTEASTPPSSRQK